MRNWRKNEGGLTFHSTRQHYTTLTILALNRPDLSSLSTSQTIKKPSWWSVYLVGKRSVAHCMVTHLRANSLLSSSWTFAMTSCQGLWVTWYGRAIVVICAMIIHWFDLVDDNWGIQARLFDGLTTDMTCTEIIWSDTSISMQQHKSTAVCDQRSSLK